MPGPHPTRVLGTPAYIRIRQAYRKARLENCYSQKDIAFYLGVSSKAYSYMECGRDRMQVIDFIKLFYLYGKPMGYYLTAEELPIPGKDLFGNPDIEPVKTLLRKMRYISRLKKINHHALVERSGISDRRLRAFFGLETAITFKDLKKIAKGLDTTPGYLLACTDDKAENKFNNNYIWGELLSVFNRGDLHLERALEIIKKVESRY